MESRDARLGRLRMRSMRRGTREMDLILGDFARRRLDALPEADLALYDRLLEEPDPDLLAWVTGAEPPAAYAALIGAIRAGARGLAAPDR